MADKRINLKNPVVAGILGFLIPGAGHLYQGRLVKAVIYAVCILGLFFSGLAMADWKAVQPPRKGDQGMGDKLKYAAQLGVGLPSLYGLLQRERFESATNVPPDTLDSSMTTSFEGVVSYQSDVENVAEQTAGTITLQPDRTTFGKETISGQLDADINGEQRTLQLGTSIRLGKPIEANQQRSVGAAIVEVIDGRSQKIGEIVGTIPRSFLNWYAVPVTDDQASALHRKLGKFHELAMVMTWIAGLLNVIAIWDAVEGPAYGYGDEEENSENASPTPAAA